MKKALLLFAGLGLVMIQSQAQNGWTREAKGFYAQAALSHFSSNKYYSTESFLFDGGSEFRSTGLQLYGEYGVTDRFTVIGDVPLVMVNRFSTTESVAGVGNVRLGMKYRLLKNIPFSFQADVDIPTDDGIKLASAKEPNELGFIERINLPTSDGEWNVWTTLALSSSSRDGLSFASLFSSVNFRTQGFSHQFQAGAELGRLFFDKVYLIGKLRVQDQITSFGNPDGAVATFLYGEGTTFTLYNFSALYKIKNGWSLVASYSDYAGFIFKQRNIYDGAQLALGVSLQR